MGGGRRRQKDGEKRDRRKEKEVNYMNSSVSKEVLFSRP